MTERLWMGYPGDVKAQDIVSTYISDQGLSEEPRLRLMKYYEQFFLTVVGGEEIDDYIIDALATDGVDIDNLRTMSEEEILDIHGIGPTGLERILALLEKIPADGKEGGIQSPLPFVE